MASNDSLLTRSSLDDDSSSLPMTPITQVHAGFPPKTTVGTSVYDSANLSQLAHSPPSSNHSSCSSISVSPESSEISGYPSLHVNEGESKEESSDEEVQSQSNVQEGNMAFTVEELDTNSDYDSDMEVVQPSQIEDAKSDSSCSALEDQWPFEEVRGQATWESSDEGEEDVRIYRRKKKRWDAGIFKRSLSQNFETDSSHSDYDPLDGSKSSARRIRRRFRGPGELSSPVLEEILYSKAANSAKVENLEDVAYIKGLPANPSDDGFGLEGLPFRFLGDQMMESEDGENNLESEEKEENSLPNYRSTHCSTSEDPLQKIPSKSTAEIEHDSQMSATKFQLSLLGYLLIEINLGPIVQSLQYSIARLRHFLQPSIPAGYTRISWTCRCGKRLHADFGRKHVAAAVDFAKQAAGSNGCTVSKASFESDTSTASSNSEILSSGMSSLGGGDQSSSASSVADVSSVAHSHFDTAIPEGTRCYLLLCVNSEIHRIDLAHIDLTTKFEYGIPVPTDDQSLFQGVRDEYRRLRGSKLKNIFVIPKTIQFIKFEIINRRLSGDCVGNFEPNRIPSKEEAKKFEYQFKPCPPDIGNLPIMPHIFMHSFLEPGDHTGSVIIERLPKKVGERLSSQQFPGFGWGVYIVEGYNWKLLRKSTLMALSISSIPMLSWSIWRKDVQGGIGMGQYLVAVLTLALSIIVLDMFDR